ncbi:MAG: nicotinate-nucleotide diphosphorylase (carboxylating) [Flavobacteriales bacterium]|nr:MAG: nicotinate-nucleotide diphosphorylase (carboxylating) [Flavobacteriales bacterium]
MQISLSDLDLFITNALQEDVEDGDHTSLACIPDAATGKAELLVKEGGVLAGMEVAKKIFKEVDKQLKFAPFLIDGNTIKKGDIAFEVEGSAQSILKAERLVLNCMQRMSGIATSTHQYVQKLKGLETKILDTRKTTPGFRMLEKWAVKIGGGENHRFGLFDMIMIKDNHIDYSGGINAAIKKTADYLSKNNLNLKIEVEARNMEEVEEIIATGCINRIMLDNFSFEETTKAVVLINGQYETESSGGITLETIRQYAECGVDYISVGALTHHIKSLDLSLKAVK